MLAQHSMDLASRSDNPSIEWISPIVLHSSRRPDSSGGLATNVPRIAQHPLLRVVIKAGW